MSTVSSWSSEQIEIISWFQRVGVRGRARGYRYSAFMNNDKVTLNNFSEVPLAGKTVLMLGGRGTLEVTLRYLIERNGMAAVVSHWTSKNLNREVGLSTVLLK